LRRRISLHEALLSGVSTLVYDAIDTGVRELVVVSGFGPFSVNDWLIDGLTRVATLCNGAVACVDEHVRYGIHDEWVILSHFLESHIF
jgi:hypothetical protein